MLNTSKTLLRSLSLALLAVLAVSCGSAPSPLAPAPRTGGPLMLVDGLGGKHDVDKILGGRKTVALVFWATWCATCKAEGPALAQAARDYGDKIEFFGIVSGSDQDVQIDELERVTQQLALPYPQIRDRDGAIAERFLIQETPTIIVLGTAGKELYRGRDLPRDWAALGGSPQ